MVELNTTSEIITLLVNKIEKRRKNQKITQKNLAKKAGVSYGSYRELIDNNSISLASFISILHVLGLFRELNDLLKDNEVKSIAQMKAEDRRK
jgi:transcriptional regulator with XRE-family HTH domain